MQSIFRYPGGKSKTSIVNWILHHCPPHIKEYREPMVGGGGVFFNINPALQRWINDIHPGLIAVYQALQSRPDEFITKCKSILPAQPNEPLTPPGPRGGRGVNARLKAVFDYLKLNDYCDQALRYFFINRTVHGGRVNYNIPSRLYFSNPEGWSIVNTQKLEQTIPILQNVKITCGDYTSLFTTPGEGVWIYVDPPYYVNTKLTPSSQLYQHNFTAADHERLASVILCCKHKIAISYDDCEEVRTLYNGFNFIQNSWTYCGAASNKQKTVGNELLILNYEPGG